MGWPTPKCGTQGGYQKHIRDKRKPCDPCLQAHAEYNADVRAKETIRRMAERYAITMLVQRHPHEFQTWFQGKYDALMKEYNDGWKVATSGVDQDRTERVPLHEGGGQEGSGVGGQLETHSPHRGGEETGEGLAS